MNARAAWDVGIEWHTDVVEPPNELTVELGVVRDDHLRVTNGTAEDDYILRLIRVTTLMGQRATRRAWMPQTRDLVMSGFPCWRIELPWPPLVDVDSITYLDTDGVEQTLSPTLYQVSAPQGPTCRKGWVAPAPGETWPSTQCGALEAVTVTYQAGYVFAGSSPPEAAVPDDLIQGQLLVIGEMYKQRSETVIGFGVSVNPAYRTARSIWLDYRVP